MIDKSILDFCCGSRMFWFDKENPHTLFTDIRDDEFPEEGDNHGQD